MKKRFRQASDIRVGAVGYGGAFNMGHSHLQQMQNAGMTPVAVCEIDRERLQVAEEEWPGIETYTKAGDMLRKSSVSLVALITPHNTHAKLAVQALKAGCSVVCEKPFAITTAECDAMIRAAKAKGLLVTAYHNRHWDSAIVECVKRVRAGAIGDVVRVEAHMGGRGKPRDWWRSSKTISGGIAYDWGVHILEYGLQVIDSEIIEVSGFAKCGFWADQSPYGADANEDEVFGTVRFKNGAWMTLCISALDANSKRGRIEVTGTKGTFIMLDDSGYEMITFRKGERIVASGSAGESQRQIFYENIADHLTKGAPLIITPEWSRRPIHILDLIDRSAKAGRAMKAKYA